MKVSEETTQVVLADLRAAHRALAEVIDQLASGADVTVVEAMAHASNVLARAGFRLVSGGLHQCVREGAAVESIDGERIERLFLGLA